LQVLGLRVVILDLVKDQLLLVLLGSRDTLDIRVLLFPSEQLLLPPEHELPLTLSLRHLHDFLLLLRRLLYHINALHLVLLHDDPDFLGVSLFFSKDLPFALERPLLFDCELLLALFHQLLGFQDHLLSSFRVQLVLLHDLLHLDGFGLRSGMHFKALSLPLGFELQMLLFHLPLPLLELKSLPLQCQLCGPLSLLELSFSFKTLLGGSPLPLLLGMYLEFSALTVSLVHFQLSQFDLSLLLGDYALRLCLELLLLFLAQLLLHLRLNLPLLLDLPLLGHEFLLLPVLLLRALLLL
jgi:hypothetical protein